MWHQLVRFLERRHEFRNTINIINEVYLHLHLNSNLHLHLLHLRSGPLNGRGRRVNPEQTV